MRHLLTNRNFLAVWSAQFVSGLGDKAAVIAFFSLVLDRTGDVADLGLLAAAQVLPGVLLGPVAGVLIDRWKPKSVLVAADFLGAVVCLALPWFWDSLPRVYLAAALLATARQFAGPARLALMPEIVPEDQLQRSNALTMLSTNLILLLGMAAGGVMVHRFGAATAFRWDAMTFAASAAILTARHFDYLSVRPDRDAVAATARERWSDLRHGAVWIWRQPSLRFAVFFLATITVVTAMQPPLVFDFVRTTLGRSESQLGLIFAAAGLGGLLGAAAAAALRGRAAPMKVVAWLVALDGAFLALFAVNRSAGLAAVLFLVFGAVSTGIQINLATFLQQETPAERRGRVFGWLSPLLGPMALLSVLAGPLLAGRFGAPAVLLGAAAVELLVGIGGRIVLGRGLGESTPEEEARTKPVPAEGLKAMEGKA